MRRCNVCGKKFRLLAKNRYEVVKELTPTGLNLFAQGTVYYNAFDCPYCGCQNIVGVIEKANVKDFENEPQTEKADFIDIPEGATNGEVLKNVLKETFPDMICVWYKDSEHLHRSITFSEDWWNTPYRKEQE